ncbi:hypothetical protein T459_20928 [Capsicum annuum]|uniref:Alfin N-terminal domain-containing protein n=1 Tax=Capsicum annuum TaxID=4072 RepID=A0A2G2Z5X4_CAPAN|nr:hypothetical protein T459_20928 [Capsicum annuum]
MDEKGVHFPLNAQKFIVPDVGTASPVQMVTVDEAFKNYEGRRNGIIKALTKDVDKFREFNIEKTDCFLDCDAFKVTS